MIYTVTLNPSLDYIISVDQLHIGTVNRACCDQILPGGKGINVSIVLTNLGVDNTALGFLGGFTGTKIENDLVQLGCNTEFIWIDDEISRINVKIKSEQETEVNGLGPVINKKDIEKLFLKFDIMKEDDLVVLAGSIPYSLPKDIYVDIINHLNEKRISFIVDTTGDALLAVLPYHPFLIKPNIHELGEIFNQSIQDTDEVIEYARRLQTLGARNVLVSMGPAGAILVTEANTIYSKRAPKGNVINSVGAGDSMVAGFVAGYILYKDFEKAFKMGLAAGSASAFSNNLATKDDIMRIYKSI